MPGDNAGPEMGRARKKSGFFKVVGRVLTTGRVTSKKGTAAVRRAADGQIWRRTANAVQRNCGNTYG
jgi:hypothetical protein